MHIAEVGRLAVNLEFFGFEAEEVLRASAELMCDPSDCVRELVRDGMKLRAWLDSGSMRDDLSIVSTMRQRAR